MIDKFQKSIGKTNQLIKPKTWGEIGKPGKPRKPGKTLKELIDKVIKSIGKTYQLIKRKKLGEIRKPGKNGKTGKTGKPGKPVRVVSLPKYLMFSSGSMRFIQILLKKTQLLIKTKKTGKTG